MGVKHASDGRPLPWVNPTTRAFFEAAREHRWVLQRCPRDGFFFYPYEDVEGTTLVHFRPA